MASGTAARTVLGPPIKLQPLRRTSAAAAATGTEWPDIRANRRTRPSCLEPARPVRSDRMRTPGLQVPTLGESPAGCGEVTGGPGRRCEARGPGHGVRGLAPARGEGPPG